MRKKVIIIETPWDELTYEQEYREAWIVEGGEGLLYCIDSEGEGNIDAQKVDIKKLIQQNVKESDFLIFVHHWDKADIDDLKRGWEQYEESSIKCFSIAYGSNFVYLKEPTQKGLLGVHRLGSMVEDGADSNEVVKSFENHTLFRKNFEEVWNFYYYQFDRKAVDLRAGLLLLSTSEAFWSRSGTINFYEILQTEHPQLLVDIQMFVGVNLSKNEQGESFIDIRQYVEEQENERLETSYEQLTEALSATFLEPKSIDRSSARRKLREIGDLFIPVLTERMEEIYE